MKVDPGLLMAWAVALCFIALAVAGTTRLIIGLFS